jgi:hypothetical protein
MRATTKINEKRYFLTSIVLTTRIFVDFFLGGEWGSEGRTPAQREYN